MESRTHTCCRCGETVEPASSEKWESVSLTLNEQAFIRSKFNDALCIPCLNQLKTSYRIVKGIYNSASTDKDLSSL